MGHSACRICDWVKALQLSHVRSQLPMNPLRSRRNITKAQNSACTRGSSTHGSASTAFEFEDDMFVDDRGPYE